ncbi:hypothetical protein FACS189451_01170 [Bacteroidia bacterium]|nr:hypothetical protein FACS189446_8570 [Bacteroidia bacterium]GHT60678.1 hypothetical protein FACS189451_01170 [Bacteroidia bacterium]
MHPEILNNDQKQLLPLLKLFRAQLAYHADIDYTEEVCFLPGFEVNPEEVKQFLIDISIKI